MSGLVSPNGSPLFVHADPSLVAQVLHDGSTALAGCPSCANPERAARILHDVADRLTGDVLSEVRAERLRQDEKWGEQNHPDGTGDDVHLLGDVERPTYGTLAYLQRANVDELARQGRSRWSGILLEEVFEALSATSVEELRAELVQVAAVAVQWVAAIDRRQS